MDLTTDIQKLVQRALTGEHNKFELITNTDTFTATEFLFEATTKITEAFTKAQKKAYDDYIKKLSEGIDNVQLLVSGKTFEHCADFYKQEADLIKSSLDEYRTYLLGGRLIEAALGKERAASDMFDFRTGEVYGESEVVN